MAPKEELFKGRPVLTLNPGDKFPYSFGMAKAQMILDNIDAIKAFVERNKRL
jgi:hypothetical protein